MVAGEKTFPIKTSPACQLKWTWSTIRLYEGTTSSCHRTSKCNIDVDNFDTFHNTDAKVKDRQKMLSGEWPGRGCEYCKNIEDVGGKSDRLHHSSIPNLSPIELETDLTATIVTPKIIEVYFDNTCNLQCVYCWDGFSSKIQAENKKFGKFESEGVVLDNYATKVPDINALTDKFFEWLSKHHNGIKQFHFLGGEPFYQRQFDRLLDFFDDHPSPNLEFTIVSNLTVPQERIQSYIQRIKGMIGKKKLRRLDIMASLDCFGPEQEYVRHGVNLQQWKDNFEYLAKQRWVYLNFNQTHTGLTLKTAPELIQWVANLRKEYNRSIAHSFGDVVFSHSCLRPSIFGKGFFDKDFAKIYEAMKDYGSEWQNAQMLGYMKGLQSKYNNSKRDYNEIKKLGVLLDEIDRRRNLNWKETFPWLITLVDESSM
jgi:organic radical activating enzyme